MPKPNSTSTNAKITLAAVGGITVLLAAVGVVAVAVAGVAVLAFSTWFAGGWTASPNDVPNHSLEVTELEYLPCTLSVSGVLTGTRSSNANQPVVVTITATSPDHPEEVYRVTAKSFEQMRGKRASVRFELTEAEAAAFGHPQARKTVSIRGANGQAILADRPWPQPPLEW